MGPKGTWIGLVAPEKRRLRNLKAGEALFRQGDAAVAVCRVDRGRVRLVRHLEDGASVALHVANAGETFAEAALWADVYHCDCVAEAALTTVTMVPKAALLDALEGDADASLALARGLAAQVRELRARLEIRNIRSAPERIMAWLRMQASGDPPAVRLERPWTEIATEVGLTHEALYRSLAVLAHTGRIARGNRTVTLLGPAGQARG
ncbi:Crp/Fnr family transcriptional regulator [Azospirillum agricola]|uniref:Crp/Fnr family transcriptional regulator n=1 Tax=Azospirillum agricola TaxID=1720247 RepID=UPI000A0F2717|nr:Crp/Fnr family transcriptional regulator [Azospirillum agricola]SMH61561.1 cAMP-binding domain of CRP or a regulatory subunit of cAMP-dependent protein kinases [Azospirillum lipoferum]